MGRTVQDQAHITLTFALGPLERSNALAVFVETIELVVGLRRTGRGHVDH